MTRAETRERRKQIIEYRKAGHYVKECAERFGVSTWTVIDACKKTNFAWKGSKGNEEKARAITNNAGWCEYIDGFRTYKSRVNVRCRTCNRVINVSFNTIVHGKSRCPECEADRNRARQEVKRAEQEEKERAQEEKRRSAALSRNYKQIRMKTCQICGAMFYGRRSCCSPECSAEVKKRRQAIRNDRRLRSARCENADGITLKKLFDKSKGICALCGKACDWNDYKVDNGTYIAGNNYPSIDHVLPLAHGGKHTWGNVQLAHRICNSLKSDTPLG